VSYLSQTTAILLAIGVWLLAFVVFLSSVEAALFIMLYLLLACLPAVTIFAVCAAVSCRLTGNAGTRSLVYCGLVVCVHGTAWTAISVFAPANDAAKVLQMFVQTALIPNALSALVFLFVSCDQQRRAAEQV
jgi:hypothetical protein